MVDLAKFRRHVQDKSPAFVPLFQDQSRYQIAWGGAGCVHPETKIHTEHGVMRICDIDRPMRVLSWSEKSQQFQLSLSGGAFPKGKDYLYQVSTPNGVFQSSGHHLVLLSTGEYQRVDMLVSGDELSQAQPCQNQTISEYCQTALNEDAQHYSETNEDLMGRYADECRRYDPLPQELGDYALFSEQQQDDVQVFDRLNLPLKSTFSDKLQTHNHPYLCDDQLYKNHFDEMGQQIELDEGGQTLASSFVHISHSHLVPQQSQLRSEYRRTSGLSFEIEQEPSDYLVDSYIPPSIVKSTVLFSASPVLSIVKSEVSKYWCMQVLDTNNYVSEDGTIHHNSGKSHIVARKMLYRILKESDQKHNFLIIRKVDRTIKRSVFTLIRNIISVWGLNEEFNVNLTDKTIVYKKNGSQFMFSGLDDVEKMKSIEGVSSIWIEEATELTQEDFEQLDLRLRGQTKYIKQIIMTFNPISEQHWTKRVFFDDPIKDVFTLKTTYLDNYFIDSAYKMVMENKKKTNPRYYTIYALGNWGTADGLVFNNVSTRLIRQEEIDGLEYVQGLDFGYTNDPSAFNQTYIDVKNKKIFVYDGFYEKGLSNSDIAVNIKKLLAHRHMTTADSSEPKSIDYLKTKGVIVRGAMKGAGSISTGLDFLLEFDIVVNAHLVEFMVEFDNYCWAVDKNNKQLNKPVDDFNHFIDSLRYACEHHTRNKSFVFAC